MPAESPTRLAYGNAAVIITGIDVIYTDIPKIVPSCMLGRRISLKCNPQTLEPNGPEPMGIMSMRSFSLRIRTEPKGSTKNPWIGSLNHPLS